MCVAIRGIYLKNKKNNKTVAPTDLRKRRRKEQDGKSLLFVIIVFIAIIIISSLYKQIFINVGRSLVEYGNMNDSYKTDLIVFRNEYTVPVPDKTKISLNAKEGERVPLGFRVAELEKGAGFDKALSLKITEIDNQIDLLKKINSKGGLFSQELEDLQANINKDVDYLRQMAENGDLSDSSDVVKDLSAKVYRKNLIIGKDGRALTIEELNTEKSALQMIYIKSTDAVIAVNSGLVAYSLDGFEKILTPENGMKLTPLRLQELSSQLRKSNELSKGIRIVDNFEWYGAMLIPEHKAETMKVNERHSILLSDGNTLKSYIAYISAPDNGFCVVFVRINDSANNFWKTRIMNADFVIKSHDGFILPDSALTTLNNTKGVYIIRKSTVRFVPVTTIMFKDGKVVVDNVKSTEDAYILRVFDEVITTPERAHDKQFLDGY